MLSYGSADCTVKAYEPEPASNTVAPSSLRKKGIEDDDLLVTGTPTAGEAPLKHLRVVLFFERHFHDGFV